MELSRNSPSSPVMDDMAMVHYLIAKHGVQPLIAFLQSHGTTESYSSSQCCDGHADTRMSVLSNGSSAAGSLFSDLSSEAGAYSTPPVIRSDSLRRLGTHSSQPRMSSRSRPRNLTVPAVAPATSKESQFHCPFCAEHKIAVCIARKSDLKRHFQNFHNCNAQWTCASRGCQMVFDWKSAYENHLKEVHQGVHSDGDMIETCPRVVFACGFTNCKQVYEANDDDDAAGSATSYFNHVAKHFNNDGSTGQDWSYSMRFRNLMRQAPIDEAWKSRTGGRTQMTWQPQGSSTLRKMLETRHIPNAGLFVKWAVTLGSQHYSELEAGKPRLPMELSIPVQATCSGSISGHKADAGISLYTSRPEHLTTEHDFAIHEQSPMSPASKSTSSGYTRHGTPIYTTTSAESQSVPAPKAIVPPVPALSEAPITSLPPSYPNSLIPTTRGTNLLAPSHVHPLWCYNGFATVTTHELPTPRAVIADIEKRIQAKIPPNRNGEFIGHLVSHYPSLDDVVIASEDVDMLVDVDMMEYPASQSSFYMG